MAACRQLPASWQTWSMWSATASRSTTSREVWPITQPGASIQASSAAPITAPRAMSRRICSSENWRSPGHQGPAVVVAGEHRAAEQVERLEEARVGEVRRVEDHPQPVELREQPDPVGGERAVVARADRVAAPAVVGQVHRAQAEVPPGLRLLGVDDRVGPLHGQDEADRLRRRSRRRASGSSGRPALRPCGSSAAPRAVPAPCSRRAARGRRRGRSPGSDSRGSGASALRASGPRAWPGRGASPGRRRSRPASSRGAWWWRVVGRRDRPGPPPDGSARPGRA